MARFAREMVTLAEQLFREGEIETLTRRRSPESPGFSADDTAVRLIHLPSGTVVTCDDYDTQLRDQAAALLRLYHQLRDLN